MKENIHATCISIKKKGVLFLGKSGAGKSDLALKLMAYNKAKLVADDRVDLQICNKRLKASCPENIKGLLEVRNVGIIKVKHVKSAFVELVVELKTTPQERLPDKKFYEFENLKIPLIKLNPFENSAPVKILAALSLL